MIYDYSGGDRILSALTHEVSRSVHDLRAICSVPEDTITRGCVSICHLLTLG